MGSIKIQRYDSPAGELILGSLDGKLCLCDWALKPGRDLIDGRIQRALGCGYEEGSSEVLRQATAQLDEFFAGQRREFTVEVLMCGTEFQRRAWAELMKIPYGSTISYAEQARRIGHAYALRAVAAANARNLISIFVPCHRVIGSNNRLTGYSGGLEAKRFLLALEADNELMQLSL